MPVLEVEAVVRATKRVPLFFFLSDHNFILIIYFSVEKKVTCHESARILDLVEVVVIVDALRLVGLHTFENN